MSNKLHLIIHTINGTLANTYDSWHEDLVGKDILYPYLTKEDLRSLIHYGSFKTHEGNCKHCFYYTNFNTI